MSFVVQSFADPNKQITAAKSLFDILALRIKINEATNTAAKDANAKSLLGISPSTVPTTSDLQKINDRFYQKDLALSNLQQILSYSVAHEATQWLNSTNDLTGFNTFFSKFKEEFKDLKNINVQFFKGLWGTFKKKVELLVGSAAEADMAAPLASGAPGVIKTKPSSKKFGGILSNEQIKGLFSGRDEEKGMGEVDTYSPYDKGTFNKLNENIADRQLGLARNQYQGNFAKKDLYKMIQDKNTPDFIENSSTEKTNKYFKNIDNRNRLFRDIRNQAESKEERENKEPEEQFDFLNIFDDVNENKDIGEVATGDVNLATKALSTIAALKAEPVEAKAPVTDADLNDMIVYLNNRNDPVIENGLQKHLIRLLALDVNTNIKDLTDTPNKRKQMVAKLTAKLSEPQEEPLSLISPSPKSTTSSPKSSPKDSTAIKEFADNYLNGDFYNEEHKVDDLIKLYSDFFTEYKEPTEPADLLLWEKIRLLRNMQLRGHKPEGFELNFINPTFTKNLSDVQARLIQFPDIVKSTAVFNEKEILALIEKLGKNKILSSSEIKYISGLIDQSVDNINATLENSLGKEDIMNDLQIVLNDNASAGSPTGSPTASASTVSSDVQKLFDFFSTLSSDITNYKIDTSKNNLTSAFNKFMDPKLWKKITENQQNDAKSEFNRVFKKPSTDTSDVGIQYRKIEYIFRYYEVENKRPSSSILNTVAAWDDKQLKSGFKGLATKDMSLSASSMF